MKKTCYLHEQPFSSADIQVIEADISDEGMITATTSQVKQCDIVVHLAANLDMKGSDETISANYTYRIKHNVLQRGGQKRCSSIHRNNGCKK